MYLAELVAIEAAQTAMNHVRPFVDDFGQDFASCLLETPLREHVGDKPSSRKAIDHIAERARGKDITELQVHVADVPYRVLGVPRDEDGAPSLHGRLPAVDDDGPAALGDVVEFGLRVAVGTQVAGPRGQDGDAGAE